MAIWGSSFHWPRVDRFAYLIPECPKGYLAEKGIDRKLLI